ncbi:MAG: Hpt domain-containing protein [Christensenellales bacterium]
MTLQEFYAQIGGSYADTVRRLCSESFVLRFVKKYPANPSFDELCEAVNRSDWESAFRAAHTLKGVAQNLGFDRLYAVSVPLTEAMRGAKPLDDFSLLAAVQTVQAETLAAIAKLDDTRDGKSRFWKSRKQPLPIFTMPRRGLIPGY